MSDSTPRGDRLLLRRVDEACDRFEATWKAGQRPRIEDYLDAAWGPDRAALTRELVSLDISYRQRGGEQPTPEDYWQRFPDHHEAIVAAFATMSQGHPEDPRIGPAGVRTSSDDNLLFGVLALQLDFITHEALIAAMYAWVVEKTKPLGRILVEQGGLAEDEHAVLEPLVAKHLHKHGDDPQRCLAALYLLDPVRQNLEQVADTELSASLARVSAACSVDDPHTTAAPSVGQPTSAGNRFVISFPLATGGLGAVFVAHDRELNRHVALKEIQDCYADQPERRARFLLEAEITGKLEHPGIVPVYGLGQYPDGRPFYAMRLIRGCSLKTEIHRFHRADVPGRDPGERALALRKLLGRFLDVCNAIDYAHSRGVLHRDLKPSNIMLGKYGETLVVDWGLAKPMDLPDLGAASEEKPLVLAASHGSAETQPGSTIGTPAYMSPEQAAGRLDRLGPSSDVYGLGATLYCLLTDHAPVEDPDIGRVLQRVQRGDFPPPRQLDPRIAPALEAICGKAMSLKPEDRYASPRALSDDIEHWLADEPVLAYREGWSQGLSRWGRRHRAWARAGASALLLVTAVSQVATLIIQKPLAYWERRHLAWAKVGAASLLLVTAVPHASTLNIQKSLAQWRRRHRAWAKVGVAAMLMVTAASLIATLIIQSSRAVSLISALVIQSSRHETQSFLAQAALDRGLSLCAQGNVRHGILWLARSLQIAPADETDLQYRIRLSLSGWGRQFHGLRGSLGQITAGNFSPDGRFFITGSEGGTARLWDVATAKPVGAPMAPGGKVTGVFFSPDGRTVLTVSDFEAQHRDEAQLWDVASTRPVGAHVPNGGRIDFAAFGREGRIVLTRREDRERLLDAGITKQASHTRLSYSPDRRRVLASSENEAQLWDVATAKPVGASMPYEGRFDVVEFSPDGRTLLTVNSNETRLWDVTTAKPVGSPMPKKEPVTAAAFSPDGRTVLTCGIFEARRWDVATAKPVGAPIPLEGGVISMAFSPDGRTVLIGSFHGAWLWDVATAKPVGAFMTYKEPVIAVGFSPDGRTVLTQSVDGTALLWDVTMAISVVSPIPLNGGVISAAFSPDGRTVLTGWAYGARSWEVATAKFVGSLMRHRHPVEAVAFSPDGRTVLTGSSDGARLWDVATAKPVGSLMVHRHPVAAVAFSPDGKTFQTCGDIEARRWDVASAKPVGSPIPLNGGVISAAFSPDGRTVLTGSSDGARLWDVATAKPVGSLMVHRHPVAAVAFSPDGKTVLTGNADGALLWDVATAKPIGAPMQHKGLAVAWEKGPFGEGLVVLVGRSQAGSQFWEESKSHLFDVDSPISIQDPVKAVAFSPDGRTILTVSSGTARLWDVATSKLVGLPVLTNSDTVAFAPDGRTVVLLGREGDTLLWNVPTPVKGDAERVVLWTQIITGKKLNDLDGIDELDPETVLRLRQDLENLGGLPLL